MFYKSMESEVFSDHLDSLSFYAWETPALWGEMATLPLCKWRAIGNSVAAVYHRFV